MSCHSIYTWMVEHHYGYVNVSLDDNFLANALLQYLHLNDLTPVWVRPCVFRWPLWANALSQYLHLNGLTPVWVRWCICRWHNLGPKCLVTVFTLEWFNTGMDTFMMSSDYNSVVNVLSQYLQLVGFTVFWFRMKGWTHYITGTGNLGAHYQQSLQLSPKYAYLDFLDNLYCSSSIVDA